MQKLKIIFLIFFSFHYIQSADNLDDPLRIYLFYTNDLHGRVDEQKATYLNQNFPPILGGGAATATIVKKYRKIAEDNGDILLLFDGGDFMFGSMPLGETSKGLAIINYMNRLGYDALVPGNHDFDLGLDVLLNTAQNAAFPFLTANILTKKTFSPPLPIKPYTIIEKNGIKIGVLGIISKSAENNDEQENVEGIYFSDEIPAAKRAVSALQKENVDLIIALAHLGLPYDAEIGYDVLQKSEKQNILKNSYINTMDLARYVPGIDMIISGQIHKGYQQPWEDPINHTLCFQNYARGGNLGMVTLHIDRKSHTITGYQQPSDQGGLILLSEDEIWPDKEFAGFIDSLQNQYIPDYNRIVGTTETTLSRASRGESPLANLMCDAMVNATKADFAFNNFVSMRSDIPIGPITPKDISRAFPFGNEIIIISLKGELLAELLEGSIAGYNSGLAIGGGRVIADHALPDGEKILSFTINGKTLDPEMTYRIATTEYLAEGNYGMTKLAFLHVENFTSSGIKVGEAVSEYVQMKTPLKIKKDGRWVLRNR